MCDLEWCEIGAGMNSQVERGTVREMVHTIAFRAGVLERILGAPVLGGLEIRADELAHVQLLQRQIDYLRRYLNLPSAEPERKEGKWNFIGDNMFKCTCCGVLYTTHQLNGLRNYDTDPYVPYFCPNCGADMRGDR